MTMKMKTPKSSHASRYLMCFFNETSISGTPFPQTAHARSTRTYELIIVVPHERGRVSREKTSIPFPILSATSKQEISTRNALFISVFFTT